MTRLISKLGQWISFRLNDELYALPIDTVKEIIPYTIPVPVSGAASEVEGILNVRGEIVAIMSGHLLLNLSTENNNDDARIILIETKKGEIGLKVDSIGEIKSIAYQNIETNPNSSDSDLIRGVTHKDGELIILIDLFE